jgi:hypothetical protein
VRRRTLELFLSVVHIADLLYALCGNLVLSQGGSSRLNSYTVATTKKSQLFIFYVGRAVYQSFSSIQTTSISKVTLTGGVALNGENYDHILRRHHHW